MRARSLPAARGAAPLVRRPSAAALVFLRGRDADGRLRELAAVRARSRPTLGALARRLAEGRLYQPFGFRSLGDFARERLGLEARTLREWARVWRALERLSHLRGAVEEGEVSWSAARAVVAVATPETDADCLASVRGRTLRAVQAMVAAVQAAERRAPDPDDEEESAERVSVKLPATRDELVLWLAACELARLFAGEALPAWQCAEAIAAECAAAFGTPALEEPDGAAASSVRGRPTATHYTVAWHGLAAVRWPGLPWRPAATEGSALPDALTGLAAELDRCAPAEIDRRLRAAVAFLQSVDLEVGRILKQVTDRRLHRELGFESFEAYVTERLDLAPRTARRLLRLARAPEPVATAFREGRITLLQAEAVLRGGSLALAERVTLRRLEDELAPAAVAFRAPREVAALFRAAVGRLGLARVLAHAVAAWVRAGRQFRDYADFERDGYRCTVPGCTARRNLQSHHVEFLSHGGADVPENRTTLCALHHHQGVHARRIRIRGEAPDALVFETPLGRWRSGDVRL